jgi:hypothetical protein
VDTKKLSEMVKSVYFCQKFKNNFLSTQIDSDFRFKLQITFLLRVIGTNEVYGVKIGQKLRKEEIVT